MEGQGGWERGKEDGGRTKREGGKRITVDR